MPAISDTHSPSFFLFPVNDNRTAWRAVGLPIILVCPSRRTINLIPIPDSLPLSALVTIEGAPNEALVNGPDHIGLRFPDRDLASVSLSQAEILDRIIETKSATFIHNGVQVGIDQAVEGDTFLYKTTNGVTAEIPWSVTYDYFDLSDIQIETEPLPQKHYNLVYSCQFYERILFFPEYANVDTDNSELICIDVTHVVSSLLKFEINHPGEVMAQMYRLTPSPYLDSTFKADDTTVSVYRPLSNALQDVYDEQAFIASINDARKAPYQMIPYISSILGWEIPYFPDSLDDLRRAILLETTYLQKLKGSKRAITELLALFGYTVILANLWSSRDGKLFIAPGDKLPPAYSDQEITYAAVPQVDPVMFGYQTSGFGQQVGTLVYRPQVLSGQDIFQAATDSGNLAIDAYLVTAGSPADTALATVFQKIMAAPSDYGRTNTIETDTGFIQPTELSAVLVGTSVLGYSRVLLSPTNPPQEIRSGATPPLRAAGVLFDRVTNELTITFDGYLDLTTSKVYCVASYVRQDIVLPSGFEKLNTNRFDIQFLDTGDSGVARPDVIDFLLDFVYKVKAFHSLLNLVKYRTDLNETYAVTDLCVGGNLTQRYDTDAGRQQVPPAIIPGIPNSCLDQSPTGLGYKPTDLAYRQTNLGNLLEEATTWAAIERDTGSVLGSPIQPAQPDETACPYAYRGQTRVTAVTPIEDIVEENPQPGAGQPSSASESHLRPSPLLTPGQPTVTPNSNSDTRGYGAYMNQRNASISSFCTPDGQTDYCYKGRVADDLLVRMTADCQEVATQTPGIIGMGTGVYWTYPARSRVKQLRDGTFGLEPSNGVDRPAQKSKTNITTYTGGSLTYDLAAQLLDPLGQYLSIDRSAPLPKNSQSWLGRLYRAFGPDEYVLHYDNRPGLLDFGQANHLAIQRPSLEIAKANMHFPGCRFPTMGKLEDDFVSDTWYAKPWDDQYSEPADECNAVPSWLGAFLVVGTDGIQRLEFVCLPFIARGNGLTPDISSMSGTSDDKSAVHSIYSWSDDIGHEAIELDNITIVDDDEVMSVDSALFPSAVPQEGSNIVDFIDGYASSTGDIAYEPEHATEGFGRGLYDELFLEMGIPAPIPDPSATEVSFTLSSGMPDGSQGLRLDAGTAVAVGTSLTTLEEFQDEDGIFDFNGDFIFTEPIQINDEYIGVNSNRLDGTIKSLCDLIGV